MTMTLTKNERLMLLSLYSLMKGQRLMMDRAGVKEPDEENDIPTVAQCCHAIEILRCGYEALYDYLPVRFVEQAMPLEDGKFVMEVFHMFDDISRYMEEHPEDKEVSDHKRAKFLGFDGNNDRRSYEFARFFTETLKPEQHGDLVKKREEELSGGDPFNSHSRITRKIYEVMLEEWRKQAPLDSREKVMAVLNAEG